MDTDKFIGEQSMYLDADGLSPLFRCIIPSNADHVAVVDAIVADIRAVLEKHCIAVEFTSDICDHNILRVSHVETIVSKAEQSERWDQNLREIQQGAAKAHEAYQQQLRDNPDNGKSGYWHVDGVRHDAFVLASSDQEAIDKAADVVGSCESPSVYYVGEKPECMG